MAVALLTRKELEKRLGSMTTETGKLASPECAGRLPARLPSIAQNRTARDFPGHEYVDKHDVE
jgi:hypothetical protein